MFTAQQQAIINTGKYGVAFNVAITGLKGGNAVYWTTLPFDVEYNNQDYESENFLTAIDSLVTSSTEKQETTTINIAGSISMLSAFDQCNGAQVEIDIGIYSDLDQVYFNPVFYGTVTKYAISRGVSKVSIALQIADKINSLQMTNSRLLTPEDQRRRSPLDQCLRYIKESTTAIFWGKGVE